MAEETTQAQPAGSPEGAPNTAGNRGDARATRESDAAIGALAGEPKFRSRRRKRVSFLTVQKIESVDYKDVATLKRFINERGKMLSSKVTGNTAKQQRMIARAIRRAREMALLPFVVTEMTASTERSFPRPRRGDYGRDRNPEPQESSESKD